MSDMRELEAEGKRCDGTARLFDLFTRQEIHVSGMESFLREASTGSGRNTGSAEEMAAEQTTVVIFEMRHRGELPANLAKEMERRAYDLAATKGAILLKQTHQVLPVREMP